MILGGPRKTTRPALSVGFILTPRFTLSAFANFVDVLRLSADEGDRSRQILCSWKVLSTDLTPVSSSCGVDVRPQQRLGDPREFDYLVVVGGLIDSDVSLTPKYVRYLKQAAELNIPLIGVCTGSFALHAAGLMQGYRCCVSWFHYDDFLERFDGMEAIANQIFVVDRDRITCSGGSASAHLAAYLVDKHIGGDQARKSLNIMIIDSALTGDVPQPLLEARQQITDPLVKKALHIMRQHLESPLSSRALARDLGVSARQLERRFRNAMNFGPSDACRKLRIDHARSLLSKSDRSIARIAADTGFSDSSHFIRVFRSIAGMTPAAYRLSAGETAGSA